MEPFVATDPLRSLLPVDSDDVDVSVEALPEEALSLLLLPHAVVIAMTAAAESVNANTLLTFFFIDSDPPEK